MVVTNWMNLLSPYVRSLLRFSSLTEEVLQQVADLATVVENLGAAYSIESAVGDQLDTLAASVGISREELPDGSASTDAEFRSYLFAKLSIWRWNGTNESLPATLIEAFPGQTVLMTDNCDLSVTATGTLPSNAIDILPVPAGVKLIV